MYGEETGLHGENHQPVASHSQTLSYNVVSSTPRQILYLMRAHVYYVPLRSEFRVVISATFFAYKRCSVRHFLQLFVGGLVSYLRYLRLFGYSGVQHILCCVFALFVFVLCTLCC
jgi:hypothetical protein